jgi:hypothetical protein
MPGLTDQPDWNLRAHRSRLSLSEKKAPRQSGEDCAKGTAGSANLPPLRSGGDRAREFAVEGVPPPSPKAGEVMVAAVQSLIDLGLQKEVEMGL